MGLHSRRSDHAVARQRAAAARDSTLLMLEPHGWRMSLEDKAIASRVYSEVYLRVRQELKAARAAEKESR